MSDEQELKKIMREYAKHHELKQSRAHPCLSTLLGKRCDCYSRRNSSLSISYPENHIPGLDHQTVWNYRGKVDRIISHQYPIHMDAFKEMIEFAEKYELQFTVQNYPNWYLPDGVVTVIWERNDKS